MFTKKLKGIWFITSYMPLYILLIIYNLDIKSIEGKNFGASFQAVWEENAIFNWILFILCFISIIVLLFVCLLKSNKVIECTSEQVENCCPDVLNYFITYLFPILTMDIKNTSSVICNVLIFMIIGMFYLQSEQLHWNPTLIFIGINIFEINGKVVMTRKNRDNLVHCIANNNQIWVHEICPGIYIEKEQRLRK